MEEADFLLDDEELGEKVAKISKATGLPPSKVAEIIRLHRELQLTLSEEERQEMDAFVLANPHLAWRQ